MPDRPIDRKRREERGVENLRSLAIAVMLDEGSDPVTKLVAGVYVELQAIRKKMDDI